MMGEDEKLQHDPDGWLADRIVEHLAKGMGACGVFEPVEVPSIIES